MNAMPTPYAPYFKQELVHELDELAISAPMDGSEASLGSPVPSDASQPRRRRKREAIEIPEELAASMNNDEKEVKKLKNRIAAARLRERSQQKIRDLEAEVAALRQRTQFLESIVQQCSCCSAAANGYCVNTTPFPSSPAPTSATSTPCHSPSSMDEGVALTQQAILSELEDDLLHQLLWQSEELLHM
ncbi:hypothetical protein Poli38472_013712 [Pythium oligandrum]|uniref:BZIP domain-containing protein n=1 Tax=Pythium oligandrum TaxID=41045 RepID=A0A8K1CDV5_PYTOL|nr:hypothetical protein Poli38472_013712 [Pythium oligandrum]|eukprot:TMW61249.1 hypothetical protein Poli38472_013712 [Pythium oligandrum]